MAGILALALGAWLAWWAIGDKGRAWSERVLCVLSFFVLQVVFIVGAIFKWSVLSDWDAAVSLFVGFFVAAVASLAALVWRGGVTAVRVAGWRGVAVASFAVALVAGALSVGFYIKGREEGGAVAGEIAPVEVPHVLREVVEKSEEKPAAAAVEAVDCRCSVGAECVGPRGGLYCIVDDGKKRYKGK